MLIYPGLRWLRSSKIQQLLNSAAFFAPNTHSLNLTLGTGSQTITRATTATVADNSGLLVTAASGEAAFKGARRIAQDVWANTDSNGALIPAATLDGADVWPAATNICLQSNTLGTAPWVAGNVAYTASQYAGASGATDLGRVRASAGNAQHYFYQPTLATTAVVHTISFDAKYVNHRWLAVDMLDGATHAYASIDLLNGTVGSLSAGVTAEIELKPTGLYRIQVHRLMTAVAGTIYFILNNADSLSFVTWNAAGTEDVGIGNVLVEALPYATPYIAATTIAVARNASVISVPTASNIASAAGFIALEYTPQHAPSGTVYLWGTYVDANNGTAILHDATNLIFRKRIAGVNYDATIANTFVSGTTYKMAASWGSGGTNIALGGTLGTPNTTGITGSPYISLPGSGYVSAPDSADQRPTGNVTLIAKVGAADYTPTSANVIYIDGDNVSDAWHSLYVYIDTTGVVVVSRPTASGTARSYTSTAGLSSVVSDNADVYLKCAWEQNVGGVSRCTFSYSIDGDSYTQLGNVVTHADVTAAHNINGGGPRIGQAPSYGGFPFNGRIYSVKLLDATNTAVIDCNPADYTSGGTTWPSSTTGEVYTVNGTASMWPFVRIASTMQTGADGNGASQPGMAIKNVYVGNRALSNAELQAISLR